jgi:hypothetical protein
MSGFQPGYSLAVSIRPGHSTYRCKLPIDPLHLHSDAARQAADRDGQFPAFGDSLDCREIVGGLYQAGIQEDAQNAAAKRSQRLNDPPRILCRQYGYGMAISSTAIVQFFAIVLNSLLLNLGRTLRRNSRPLAERNHHGRLARDGILFAAAGDPPICGFSIPESTSALPAP